MTDIPAGKCPEHGRVWGDDVEMRFPTGATCTVDGCGTELETAGYVDEDELPSQ